MNRFRIKLILIIPVLVYIFLVLIFCWKSRPLNVGAALLVWTVMLVISYLMSSADELEEKEGKTKEEETERQPDKPKPTEWQETDYENAIRRIDQLIQEACERGDSQEIKMILLEARNRMTVAKSNTWHLFK